MGQHAERFNPWQRSLKHPACTVIKPDGEVKLGIPDLTRWYTSSPMHVRVDVTIRAATAGRNLQLDKETT